jgi:hypothetical protein
MASSLASLKLFTSITKYSNQIQFTRSLISLLQVIFVITRRFESLLKKSTKNQKKEKSEKRDGEETKDAVGKKEGEENLGLSESLRALLLANYELDHLILKSSNVFLRIPVLSSPNQEDPSNSSQNISPMEESFAFSLWLYRITLASRIPFYDFPLILMSLSQMLSNPAIPTYEGNWINVFFQRIFEEAGACCYSLTCFYSLRSFSLQGTI